MSKTALFFPGQGSQYVGMARDLYDYSDEVKNLYRLASDEIGVDIAQLSFNGPAEELKKTRFTQPAILLHSLAVLIILKDRLPSFDFAAGHSMGEYGALVATRALSYENAIKAVVKRASLMEEACRRHPSTMAAIIGLDIEKVEEICDIAGAIGVVVPANFNSAIQTVISGQPEAVEEAVTLARNAGAKKAVKLEVGGAFHSPLMESALSGLEKYLADIPFNTAERPVIANVNAQPVTDPHEIRDLLVRQITAPVRWAQTMSWLAGNDVTTIIEIGPGKVLTGLAKRDLRPAKSYYLDTLPEIENIMAFRT